MIRFDRFTSLNEGAVPSFTSNVFETLMAFVENFPMNPPAIRMTCSEIGRSYVQSWHSEAKQSDGRVDTAQVKQPTWSDSERSIQRSLALSETALFKLPMCIGLSLIDLSYLTAWWNKVSLLVMKENRTIKRGGRDARSSIMQTGECARSVMWQSDLAGSVEEPVFHDTHTSFESLAF
jgi:hypothetical protein